MRNTQHPLFSFTAILILSNRIWIAIDFYIKREKIILIRNQRNQNLTPLGNKSTVDYVNIVGRDPRTPADARKVKNVKTARLKQQQPNMERVAHLEKGKKPED